LGDIGLLSCRIQQPPLSPKKKQWRAKPSEITSSRHRRKISATHDNLFDKIISTVISFSIHTPIANSGAVVWQFFFNKSALCKQNL